MFNLLEKLDNWIHALDKSELGLEIQIVISLIRMIGLVTLTLILLGMIGLFIIK